MNDCLSLCICTHWLHFFLHLLVFLLFSIFTAGTLPSGPAVVRLDDVQATNNMGRLNVLYKDVWATVCQSEWDMAKSHVACRQLGFGPAFSFFMINHILGGMHMIEKGDRVFEMCNFKHLCCAIF